MALFGRYLNRYRIFWLALLALFSVFVYWLLFLKPASPLYTEVDVEDVKAEAIEEQPAEDQTVDESLKLLQLNAEGAEFTVSSPDGKLAMRLWADTASKRDSVIDVEEGVLQFEMEGGGSLVLRVAKCRIQIDEDLIMVSGDITGNIRGTDQYFSGSDLRWHPETKVIAVEEVYYVGTHIEVRGEQMKINLEKGKRQVTFEGLVEAGV